MQILQENGYHNLNVDKVTEKGNEANLNTTNQTPYNQDGHSSRSRIKITTYTSRS
jgi:hypothetical protein